MGMIKTCSVGSPLHNIDPGNILNICPQKLIVEFWTLFKSVDPFWLVRLICFAQFQPEFDH